VVDAYPGMTHLLKGELDGTAWDFTLPAAVSCRMEPYPGQGMWRLDLFWLEPRALPAKDGHDPACRYCVHGPDCRRGPPSPRSVGQLSTCTVCALYITSEEMPWVRRSRPSGTLSRCSDQLAGTNLLRAHVVQGERWTRWRDGALPQSAVGKLLSAGEAGQG
jgi:hypothetical protein